MRDEVVINNLASNGTPTKPEKTPRRRKTTTKKRKIDTFEGLGEGGLSFGESEFDFAAQLESEMGISSAPTLSTSTSSDGPANPFAEPVDRPFVSMFPDAHMGEFTISKPQPPPAMPVPQPQSLPPQQPPPPPPRQAPAAATPQPPPAPSKQPPPATTPAQPTPAVSQKPTPPPKPVQKQQQPPPVVQPPPVATTPTPTSAPLPVPPTQPLFATLESVFAPPVIATPLVSYLTNPQYLELSGQETALMNEIKSLNATLDERRTQYNRASNAIVKVTLCYL